MVFESIIFFLKSLIVEFSYLSYVIIFVIRMVSSATLFLPVPFFALLIFAAELGFNPLILGISAGIGSAIGELTGYLVGVGSKRLVETEQKKQFKKNKIIKRFEKL